VVAGIAYCNYLEPSGDVDFVDSLGVSICVTRALNKVLNDPDSPTNAKLNGRLRGWCEKSGTIFWSEYFLSYGGTFPRAYYHEISATISQLVESGVSGFKSEVSPGNFPQWRSAVFFLYLVARTLYDVKTEPDALLADFCEKFYGPAAPECEEFHKINQKLFADSSLEFTSVTPELLPTIYSQKNIDELRALVETALKNVGSGDSIFNERVELLKRQIDEIADSRAAAKLADANSAIIAEFASERPTFDDFRNSALTEQLQRKNLLPFTESNKFALKWTSTHLWVYFKLGEPDTRISRKTASMGGELPFGSSNVDFFICPDPKSGSYYQICVDIAGQFYSSKCEGRSGNP
ncbi:MAG: DUF4838 domain-containing protein, partial [Victivallales bacterium]|nr:DUF4838 domain-containing protein [Victivallales bacterium]